MRGTDLTPEQLEAASAFIDLTRLSERPEPHDMVTMQFHSLVRLVTWYGAIRYRACTNGDGTETNPACLHEIDTAEI